jgi:hypothetical protein
MHIVKFSFQLSTHSTAHFCLVSSFCLFLPVMNEHGKIFDRAVHIEMWIFGHRRYLKISESKSRFKDRTDGEQFKL